MSVEKGPDHMADATANALKLIARWQSEGKLTPDSGKLTRSQVPNGVHYGFLDDPVVPARTPTGEVVRGAYETSQD